MSKPLLHRALRGQLASAGVQFQEVAEWLDYKPSQITKRMQGEIDWRLAELQTIAQRLDVPVAYLIDDPTTVSTVAPLADTGHAAIAVPVLVTGSVGSLVAGGHHPNGAALILIIAFSVLLVAVVSRELRRRARPSHQPRRGVDELIDLSRPEFDRPRASTVAWTDRPHTLAGRRGSTLYLDDEEGDL